MMEFNTLLKQIWATLLALLFFTAIFGVGYPAFTTLVIKAAFLEKANGSLVYQNKIIVGSELIGQAFSDPKYFWSRLSATTPMSYNGAASTGSNFSPANPQVMLNAKNRIELFKNLDPLNNMAIPIDLITTSGSGLDPHISLAGAHYQIGRIARVRNIEENTVYDLIKDVAEHRQFGILGECRVNVLKLNLKLDQLSH